MKIKFQQKLKWDFHFQIFFVLRKKDSQVTFLHLYHHSLTPLETWICVKFIPGGHGTLGNLINNAVHVVMYLYYMLSAMGPEYQKYLWWKKHLTTVQLVRRNIGWIWDGYSTLDTSIREFPTKSPNLSPSWIYQSGSG